MRIIYLPPFLKRFAKLEQALQEETVEKIRLFEKEPENPTLRIHKLKGRLAGRSSFSVNYRYRIVFRMLDQNTAAFLTIGDHSIYG